MFFSLEDFQDLLVAMNDVLGILSWGYLRGDRYISHQLCIPWAKPRQTSACLAIAFLYMKKKKLLRITPLSVSVLFPLGLLLFFL